ncbi:unnamed protein product [Cuscuta epithymum]|uniref:Uncharacterized protein n=1 Tax=Cuscuta epithymum TaxID=186058 RepID=A0AAV0DQE3_9ASTE|nr:unnamed protein product [Cuscuta epithymum]CAH9131283.1 unnamed protein product [Cuscuta epithymum]
MGLYSLQVREAQLAKERELIVAQENAEQAVSKAVQAAEFERLSFVEERKKLKAGLGELRVQVATLQAKIAAAEAAQIKFNEHPSQIQDGPPEVTVDLSSVREGFKTSEEFAALKEQYALEQLPAVFGRHLGKLCGEARQKERVRMLDQDPIAKEWDETLAQEVYSAGCQHMLQPILPLLEKLLGRAVHPSDFLHLAANHLNALKAQLGKCRRALGMESNQVADEEAEGDDDGDDDDDEDEDGPEQ